VLGFLGSKSGNLFGVDIGSSSVKLVSLSGGGERYGLESYAVVALPHGAVVDGSIKDPGTVAEVIEKAVKVAGNKKSGEASAVTAVLSSAVITKRIEMSNALSEFDLEDQIKIEADQFIPYPIEEVALDFEVIGPAEHSPNLNSVLLVACRQTDVEEREDVISSSGLKCKVIDVDTFAIERAYPLFGADQPVDDKLVGIVDIGASTLTLNVFKGNEIVYTREQTFGGNDLSNAISQQYGMSVEEVEQSLRLNDLSSEIEDMVVMPFRGTVAQQVSRSLQFFYSSGTHHHELSALYLSGGTAAIDGLAEQLQEEIGITTLMANPFSRMKINPRVNTVRLERDAPSLVKACGLAMRGFED
jgi:type IV pilus assembly protein PilM